MKQQHEDLLPPARLALAYAPKHARAAWELVLRFDIRLAGIVGTTSEPLIGQMKLAWWRDALGTKPSLRPKGEPLLAELSKIGVHELDRAVESLVNAWEPLVVADEWDLPLIQRFARERGSAVFGAFAELCALDDFPMQQARQWALDDLRLRFGDRVPEVLRTSVISSSRRSLTPLNILAMSVRDISGSRLIWHALTGR